jgi:hypothetical protein
MSSARVISIEAKPAGPSRREKADGSECPSCGAAMMPDLELEVPLDLSSFHEAGKSFASLGRTMQGFGLLSVS